jgi:hypothetical protein
VDVVLIIRAESALEELLPGILFGCLLELAIVIATFSALFFEVEIEAPLMEAVVNVRPGTFE